MRMSPSSLIWSRCPKTELCSLTIVETAVNMAVMVFNSEMKLFVTFSSAWDMIATQTHTNISDDRRIYQAEVKDQEAVKQRRRAMRIDRVSLVERPYIVQGFD